MVVVVVVVVLQFSVQECKVMRNERLLTSVQRAAAQGNRADRDAIDHVYVDGFSLEYPEDLPAGMVQDRVNYDQMYFDAAFDNVLNYMAGKPSNIVNPDVLKGNR